MQTADQFDTLYHRLAAAWDAHQGLRATDPPVTELAASAARLYQAKLAMWDWHRANTPRSR